jgi:hypothetical protein
MAIPARPVEGAPVDTVWGGIAHDTAVAQDIQSGSLIVNTTGGAGGYTVLTFPRPFAGIPVVVSSVNGAYTDTVSTTVDSITPTNCRVHCKTTTNFGWTLRWIAIGPRA